MNQLSIPTLFNHKLYDISYPRNYMNHRQKIQEIMTKSSPLLNLRREALVKNRQLYRDRAFKFRQNEKKIELDRISESMKKRLKGLNRQKHNTSASSLNQSKSSNRLNSSTYSINNKDLKRSKSVHLSSIKKENHRVQQQNIKLAHRLMTVKSTFDLSMMHKNFNDHRYRKLLLSKFTSPNKLTFIKNNQKIAKNQKALQNLKYGSKLNSLLATNEQITFNRYKRINIVSNWSKLNPQSKPTMKKYG